MRLLVRINVARNPLCGKRDVRSVECGAISKTKKIRCNRLENNRCSNVNTEGITPASLEAAMRGSESFRVPEPSSFLTVSPAVKRGNTVSERIRVRLIHFHVKGEDGWEKGRKERKSKIEKLKIE